MLTMAPTTLKHDSFTDAYVYFSSLPSLSGPVSCGIMRAGLANLVTFSLDSEGRPDACMGAGTWAALWYRLGRPPV